jgi:putative DNA primase/helicase
MRFRDMLRPDSPALSAGHSEVNDRRHDREVNLILEGDRHIHLASLAGTLHGMGASPATILAALAAENTAKCRPPLELSQISRIVASITKNAADARGDPGEILLEYVLERWFAGGKHLTFAPDGRFWNYSGKFWQPAPESWIDGRILDAIQTLPPRIRQSSTSLISQARALLRATLAVRGDPFAFTSEPPHVINCRNGELWINPDGSVDLRPHRPESLLRHCLDVAYDPGAKCRQYDRALKGIFASANDPLALTLYWHELVGYIIQPRRNIPIIIIMFGEGDNGKSVLAQTIVRLLGESLVQAQHVEDLDKSRFAMGHLLLKLLFLVDDVGAGARLPDGILKTISEAKIVSGELKFGPSFNFVVRAVPMLLCNNVPVLADVSRGIRRRLQVIPFDRTFTDADRDRELFQRIWAEELPGVLNRALQGYQRLVQRGSKFDLPAAVEAATGAWLNEANPVFRFVKEQCRVGDGEICKLQELYPAYRFWAQQAGIRSIQDRLRFGRDLAHLGYRVAGDRFFGLDVRN